MKEAIRYLVHSTWFILMVGLTIAATAIIGIIGEVQDRLKARK